MFKGIMDSKRFGYQNLKLFLLHISLVGKGHGLTWYLDSGRSRHMTGEKSMLLNLKPIEGGITSFGGMGKGKIIGIGKISIPSLAFIDNVLYVEGLKYNLLSISQFCDRGYIVSFNKDQCIVKIEDGTSFFIAR